MSRVRGSDDQQTAYSRVMPSTKDSGSGSRGVSVDVLLAEFAALRSEHDMRVAKQQEISQLALGVLGVSIGLVGALVADQSGLADLRGLCPLLVGVLSALMLMTLDHEMNIAHIQIYVQRHLSPGLMDALNAARMDEIPFWRWISFRAANQQHPGLWAAPFTLGIASAKYWTTLVPGLILLIAYPVLCTGRPDPWYSWAGYVAAAIIWLFAVLASQHTGRLYLGMDYQGR